MTLVCPQQCADSNFAYRLIEKWIADPLNPIGSVHFLPLGESMRNGGGPACLRLRVTLTHEQLLQLAHNWRIDESRIEWLRREVTLWYPERVEMHDLQRLDFAEHAIEASLALAKVL
jgi:succinylarginine dihydrolase